MSSHDANSKPSSTASLKQKIKTPDGEEVLDEVDQLEHPSYEELQTKLTEAEEKATYSWDRMLRVQAEMDNAQRRAERDVANAHKYALEKFTNELLPIIDGLERALDSHSEENAESGSLLDGVSLTLKMLHKAFEKFGIQQIDPEGQPFNPEHHQAVSTQENTGVKSGTVVAVLQKGYLLNGRLVRPALVVVSK